jgi:hypothetical protein
MNWYKKAKDFSERNVVNDKIHYLKDLKNVLREASNLIFQSGTLAKQSNSEIILSKKITSYPSIRDLLIEADTIALDNPWKFRDLCKAASEKISNIIYQLEEKRDELTSGNEKNIYVRKGWV